MAGASLSRLPAKGAGQPKAARGGSCESFRREVGQDEQAALTAVSFELRSRYDLLVEGVPSPYAA